MKKIFIAVLSVIMAMSLVTGCGKTKEIKIFNLKNVVGKTEQEVNKELGNPKGEKESSIKGEGAFYLEYVKDNFNIRVGFENNKVTFIGIEPKDKSIYSYQKDWKAILEGLNLKPVKPNYDEDSGKTWLNTYNVEKLTIQPVKIDDKIPRNANIERIDIEAEEIKKEDIKSLFKIEEVKNKSEEDINSLLGQPKEKEETSWHPKNSSETIKCFANIYEKNNYEIEVLFIDKITARITITPKDKISYPEENENLLKSLGISPVQCDFENSLKTEWKNKYGVYNFTINALGENINFIYIILDQKYE